MNAFFDSHPMFTNIAGGLIVSAILALLNLINNTINRKKYDYIIGEWHSYYLNKGETFFIEQEITISFNTFNRLNIFIKEKTSAGYTFKGKLNILEDKLYGRLHGVNHTEEAFLVMTLPFNKMGKVPSLNGIFTGVTQNKVPASVKTHWSRVPKAIEQIKEELGPEIKFMTVEKDTKENILRKDVDESLKKNKNN